MAVRVDLIPRYVAENPGRPGPAYARLVDSGVEIWALIAYLQAADGDIARVVADYDLPREAVEAALAYYRLHKKQLDARIVLNSA